MADCRGNVHTHQNSLIGRFVVLSAMFSSFVYQRNGLDLLSDRRREHPDAEVLHSRLWVFPMSVFPFGNHKRDVVAWVDIRLHLYGWQSAGGKQQGDRGQ